MARICKDGPTPSDVHVASAGGAGADEKKRAKLYAEIARRNLAKSPMAGEPHPHTGSRRGHKARNQLITTGNAHAAEPMRSRQIGNPSRGGRWGKRGDGAEMRKFVKAESVDAALGIVLGWAIVCKEDGRDYIDVQKNIIPENAMLEVAADFMEHSRAGNEMHAGPDVGQYLFAFPLTTEIAKAMGLATRRTGLMVGYKPTPAVLAKFVSGEYSGFSIEGFHIDLEELPA